MATTIWVIGSTYVWKRVSCLTAEGPSMVERSSLAPTAVLVWLITPKLRVTSPPRQYGRVTTGAERGKQDIRCVEASGRREKTNSGKYFLSTGEESRRITWLVELPTKTLPRGRTHLSASTHALPYCLSLLLRYHHTRHNTPGFLRKRAECFLL